MCKILFESGYLHLPSRIFYIHISLFRRGVQLISTWFFAPVFVELSFFGAQSDKDAT